MAYDKGNFYHSAGSQVLDGATIKNATIEDSAVNGVSLMTSKTVPTTETAAPGTICVVVANDGTVGIYVQEGTADSPDWNKVTTA